MNASPTASPPPRRILVRGVNWLGDAVMTTPALLRLREKFPDAHIALLGPEKLGDLWVHHPAVDESLSFQAGEGVFSIAKKLRVGKYDLALVLPNSPRSAMEVFFAGIPRRLGGARPWRNFFLTQTVGTRPEMVKMRKRTPAEIQNLLAQPESAGTKIPVSAHQTHEYLHLVAALGANAEPLAPQLVVTSEEVSEALKKFGLSNLTQPIFGLNPGAEYGLAKRWPVEKFIVAAQAVQAKTQCHWLIFGGKHDQGTAGQIAAALRAQTVTDVSGRTSLRELMALLKACRVLLSNDTGPTHAAAALGTPVVVPFGSTSPELTAPGLPGDNRHHFLQTPTPCAPCFLRECPVDFRCMNNLAAERAVAAVLQAIGTSA